MWQQAKGRAISSSGLREGALARDWARRVVARSIREGGRVEAVGIMRLRFWWIVAAEEAMFLLSFGVCCEAYAAVVVGGLVDGRCLFTIGDGVATDGSCA